MSVSSPSRKQWRTLPHLSEMFRMKDEQNLNDAEQESGGSQDDVTLARPELAVLPLNW